MPRNLADRIRNKICAYDDPAHRPDRAVATGGERRIPGGEHAMSRIRRALRVDPDTVRTVVDHPNIVRRRCPGVDESAFP